MDFVLVLAFIALPLFSWWLTRSLTWLVVRLVLGFGLAGTAVQTTISLGWGWNQTLLAFLVLGVLVVVVALAVVSRDRTQRSLRRQFIVIWIPAIVIGLFLVVMRLLAVNAGPLTAVGYLFNHPLAEDNAKWLNLTSQLAAGTDLVFNGYAGGPLLLIMVVMATFISALSMIVLGGVNEVAVAANAVVGSQFLLLALVPFVFAPFAERKIPIGPRRSSATGNVVSAPAVWVGMLVVFIASAVVTSYGHLSLQYVLNLLVLWAVVFLVGSRTPRARLLVTLALATAASAWLPLNVLGIGIVVGVGALAVWKRRWGAVGLVAITVVATWDSLISSTLYMLGIDLGSDGVSGAGSEVGDVSAGAGSVIEQSAASALLRSPGGTEIVQPLVGALAIASVLVAAAWYSRVGTNLRWQAVVPFAPIAVMVLYLLVLTLADAVLTAASPNYGIHKMAFAVVVMMLAATLPIAIMSLEPDRDGMTALRWFAVGGVVLLLSLDTMLPRALSALSPKLWPAVNAQEPQYWSAAEVRDVPEQSISEQPIACVIAPPISAVPTGLPRGQDNYTCARLLTGLAGLEYRAQLISKWMETDWLSNQPQWDAFYADLARDDGQINNRRVILTDTEGSVVGLSTIGELTTRYRPVGAP